jgi:glycosyltransferase involved in cell wall biosynthesis
MLMRATVIVPAFNNQRALDACVQGIASQSFPLSLIELIVVDNGSTPPLELPEFTSLRMRVLRCQKPGSYAARDTGARQARGDILAFTDADCIPDATWIESGVNALQQAGVGAIIGGEVKFIDPPTPTAVSLYQAIVGFQQRENIEYRSFSATANLFCSRGTFERIGDFNETLLSGGDREWCWRAKRLGIPIIFNQEAIVRTYPRTSLLGAVRQARRVAAGKRHLESYPDVVPENGVAPHRGRLESAAWILRHPNLGLWERLKVVGVAVLIRVATQIELIRIRLGGAPERR